MKKILSLILFTAMLVSCQHNEEGIESKRKALDEKQKQLSTLKAEIKTLKAEIEEMDTTTVSGDLTPVATQELNVREFEHFTTLTGSVTSKENVLVSSEAMGRVVRVHVTEGQKVSRGQVLVSLENDAISNQLNEIKSAYELAKITFEKRQRLWDQNIGSEIEYLQSKNNYERTKNQLGQIQAQYDHTFIKAPINGSVDNIDINEGELVSAGTPVARVVDLERVEIEAELSEDYLSSVHKGDTVTVGIPALNITQKVPIVFVSQVINPENRSFKIKVNLRNKNGHIKPNVLANVKIRDYVNEEALAIPSISIKKDLKGSYVYVVNQESGRSVVKKKYVRTGKSFEDITEVLSGLDAGDQIITSGFNQVTEGEEVHVK